MNMQVTWIIAGSTKHVPNRLYVVGALHALDLLQLLTDLGKLTFDPLTNRLKRDEPYIAGIC